MSIFDSSDLCAQGGEFIDDALVASLHIVDVLDIGGAFGGEAGDDQSGTGPEILCVDGGTLQLAVTNAGDIGGLALNLDLGTHVFKLRAVAEEAGLVDGLGQAAHAGGQNHADADLGLHIRGEAGVGHGLDGDPAQGIGGLDTDGVVKLGDLGTHFPQAGGDALHVLGDDIPHQNIAAGGDGCGHIGARLDLVGDGGVGAAVEGLHALDLDGVGTGAGDPGAHGVQEVGQVNDVGLLGRIFDDGLTIDQAGGQHDVGGGAHADHIQVDALSLQAVGAGLHGHILLGLLHIGTQQAEALDVLIDGTGGEGTAAGQGHMAPAVAAQLGTQQVVAGTHLANQIRIGLTVGNIGAIDLHHAGLDPLGGGTHGAHDVQQDTDIGDVGNIFDPAFAGDKQCCGQDGDHGVLCAGNDHFALKRRTADDFVFRQGNPLLAFIVRGI